MTSSNEKSNIKTNNFDKIVFDIAIYLDPVLLKDEYKKNFTDNFNTADSDRNELNKYLQICMIINRFYKKILRYELYFSEFYPN